MPVARGTSIDHWLAVITSDEDSIRNQSLDELCAQVSPDEFPLIVEELDRFWRRTENLYHRVRTLFFLASIHRYGLAETQQQGPIGHIPYASYQHLLDRRFTESIDSLLDEQTARGASLALSSALAKAYHELAFQTLADQVRRSVRNVRGNQWMFRTGHPADHPLRLRRELVADGVHFPVLRERTAVRMDFSHSAWSDIFFLGMDFPAGARVINASIDLGIHGRDVSPQPPVESYLRVIDEPVLRLVSVDLKASADVTSIAEVFDFARDYLGLLKAAVIAAGLVPPGMEGCGMSMESLLHELIGPGLGLELVSRVNGIPKGSRLAVSTNLLGSLICVCMRATHQVSALTGAISEDDRRMIAARAILGEWLGGSGGGWQDSGGVWPGVKLIAGAEAEVGDPEYGISRGRLLPRHTVLDSSRVSAETRDKLQQSLVLVHGGMAQNVGPILEMVTEKYLLRSPAEWKARQEAIGLLHKIEQALSVGDLRALGQLTHRNFFGPLQTIIPWCTNAFTQSMIEQSETRFGSQFWGFWMLGGMSGGGMGFIFDPAIRNEGQDWLLEAMLKTKRRFQTRLPFAMDPVVYDFAINDRGTWAAFQETTQAAMPQEYYALMGPGWLKRPTRELSPGIRRELEQIGNDFRAGRSADGMRQLIENILPTSQPDGESGTSLDELLEANGFDRELHEQVRGDLRSGRFGLSQNRLPPNTTIEDVNIEELCDGRQELDIYIRSLGEQALRDGTVGVVTLAAGAGSRWTAGAGVVKALHPFCVFQGRHRSFLEIHLAKSRKVGDQYGYPPHLVTTGYLTHGPIVESLRETNHFQYPGYVGVSPGKSVGLRLVPMVRDLQFAWEETQQQRLDERQERMRISLRSALMSWARSCGEATDYRDNTPHQCLHPVGHWYEFPNLLRNGSLAELLRQQPQLQTLMLHNVDTLGASLDPGLLGWHLKQQNCLTFEVIPRRLEDRGGGLARVNGQLRMIEGLALPCEQDEFKLSFYNSNTTWIDIDRLLHVFEVERHQLSDRRRIDRAIRTVAQRMPTYITLKDVKKRWGNGQEDIYPVAQFEKLWTDMTALPQVRAGYALVSLARGQQLKDPAQLDGWLRDGSAGYVDHLCEFG